MGLIAGRSLAASRQPQASILQKVSVPLYILAVIVYNLLVAAIKLLPAGISPWALKEGYYVADM
ncbi:MAG: hypothetical protein LBU85_07190 [Treponema sp.]|nr:hypothetical protein [Treponema sp.]